MDGEALLAAIRSDPAEETTRLAYADWLDESGDETTSCVVRTQVGHRVPFAITPVRDVDLGSLRDHYDWAEVFGEGSGGNCSPKADACPPGAAVDLTPPTLADVTEVIAAAAGENDGAEWVGLFRLKDGRVAIASGWCDYTGWD